MNTAKVLGAAAIVVGTVSREDWFFILSVLITILGMIQEYLKYRNAQIIIAQNPVISTGVKDAKITKEEMETPSSN